MPEVLQTEFPFTLPRGYVDPEDGTVHKDGIMRLATAGDEIEPMRDQRVQENPAFAAIIVLSRVVTELGTLDAINTRTIENLFSADFEFLQNLYNVINESAPRELQVACPNCEHMFEVEVNGLGEV